MDKTEKHERHISQGEIPLLLWLDRTSVGVLDRIAYKWRTKREDAMRRLFLAALQDEEPNAWLPVHFPPPQPKGKPE